MDIAVFRAVFRSKVVGGLIFQFVHSISVGSGCEVYSWKLLPYYPGQLIRYNYIDLLKYTINSIVKAKDNILITLSSEFDSTSLKSLRSHLNKQSKQSKKITKEESNNFVKDYILCTFKSTIACGRLDILKYLITQFFKPTTGSSTPSSSACYIDQKNLLGALGKAAKHGHIHIMQYLVDVHNIRIHDKALNCAAQGGALLALRWLYAHPKKGLAKCGSSGIDGAAAKGYLDVVELLLHHNVVPTIYAVDVAALNGHLAVVVALVKNFEAGRAGDWLCSSSAIDFAAKRGHLDIVKLLHSKHQACSTDAINYAAKDGHYDVVDFLLSNRTEGCTQEAMDLAAMNGHLDVVCLLHRKSNWDAHGASITNAINLSVKHGHLNILKYLDTIISSTTDPFTNSRQLPEEYDNFSSCSYTLSIATNQKNNEIIQYLIENRTSLNTNQEIIQQYSKLHHKDI